jgi:hypothetical protein
MEDVFMSNNFLGSNPIFPVKSVVETATFYMEKLGFNICGIWENPSYGVVSRGDAVIEFGEGRKEYAGSGICIIRVEDADAVYKEWKLNEVEFVGDIADREYGSKDFRIKDNNGNILIVGHALVNKNELLNNNKVA